MGSQIKLPKLGLMPIVLHRPIPEGFDVKTVRIVRKHSGWYATLCIQADESIPDVRPHGHSIGIDVGLAQARQDRVKQKTYRATDEACVLSVG